MDEFNKAIHGILNEMALLDNNKMYHMSDKLHPATTKGDRQIIYNINIDMSSRTGDAKPLGFWYAPGNEWLHYTRTDNPYKYSAYMYEVEIFTDNILRISNFDELIAFTKKYLSDERKNHSYINWSVVSKDYDGIEIIPYISEARMLHETDWYYTWDVACGCVWNSKIVLELNHKSDDFEDKYGNTGGSDYYFGDDY